MVYSPSNWQETSSWAEGWVGHNRECFDTGVYRVIEVSLCSHLEKNWEIMHFGDPLVYTVLMCVGELLWIGWTVGLFGF